MLKTGSKTCHILPLFVACGGHREQTLRAVCRIGSRGSGLISACSGDARKKWQRRAAKWHNDATMLFTMFERLSSMREQRANGAAIGSLACLIARRTSGHRNAIQMALRLHSHPPARPTPPGRRVTPGFPEVFMAYGRATNVQNENQGGGLTWAALAMHKPSTRGCSHENSAGLPSWTPARPATAALGGSSRGFSRSPYGVRARVECTKRESGRRAEGGNQDGGRKKRFRSTSTSRSRSRRTSRSRCTSRTQAGDVRLSHPTREEDPSPSPVETIK
jgi:uncharacterized protein YukE